MTNLQWPPSSRTYANRYVSASYNIINNSFMFVATATCCINVLTIKFQYRGDGTRGSWSGNPDVCELTCSHFKLRKLHRNYKNTRIYLHLWKQTSYKVVKASRTIKLCFIMSFEFNSKFHYWFTSVFFRRHC